MHCHDEIRGNKQDGILSLIAEAMIGEMGSAHRCPDAAMAQKSASLSTLDHRALSIEAGFPLQSGYVRESAGIRHHTDVNIRTLEKRSARSFWSVGQGKGCQIQF